MQAKHITRLTAASLFALAVAGGSMGSSPADAATIVSAGPAPSSYEIEARARNGRSGFEGVLFTPANPSPASGLTMNPSGSPVWAYGQNYSFQFTYSVATGAATWSIDFNRDNDFTDSAESVTSVSPTLAGKSFKYVNLFGQGNASSAVTVSNFTLNGTSFGPYASGDSSFAVLFEDDSGLFGNIVATGTFSFSANGSSDERPRVWVQLGSPQAVVPVPAALPLMLSALAGLGLIARRRASAT